MRRRRALSFTKCQQDAFWVANGGLPREEKSKLARKTNVIRTKLSPANLLEGFCISCYWVAQYTKSWDISCLHPLYTGCVTISVNFDTLLFSDICWRSRLSFHVVIEHSCGFDLLKFFFRVRTRYKPNLVFKLGLVLSKFKFKFSAVI